MIGDESEAIVTVMRLRAQDEVNQEDSEQNEVDGIKKGADSKGKVMHASCMRNTDQHGEKK